VGVRPQQEEIQSKRAKAKDKIQFQLIYYFSLNFDIELFFLGQKAKMSIICHRTTLILKKSKGPSKSKAISEGKKKAHIAPKELLPLSQPTTLKTSLSILLAITVSGATNSQHTPPS